MTNRPRRRSRSVATPERMLRLDDARRHRPTARSSIVSSTVCAPTLTRRVGRSGGTCAGGLQRIHFAAVVVARWTGSRRTQRRTVPGREHPSRVGDLRRRRRILGHCYSHVLVVRPCQPRQDIAGCPRVTGDADHHGHVTVRGEHREAPDRSGLVRGQRCTHVRVGIGCEMAQHPGRRRRVPGRYRSPDLLPRVVQPELVARRGCRPRSPSVPQR